MSPERSDGGGRAGAGGFDYQHRVAAWFATHVLAGSSLTPIDELWRGALQRLDLETGDPVDDVRLTPLQGSDVALQCKRTIQLSRAETGESSKTLDQFVEHHCSPGHDGDQLVLVVTSEASAPVRTHLRRLLDRLRTTEDSTSAGEIPANQDERRAYDVVTSHIVRAWQSQFGHAPSDVERLHLLRRCHVLVLDVEPGGAHETVARDRLRSLAAVGDDADAAWDALIAHCARLAANGSGADRTTLERQLATRGIALATATDYSDDVRRLEAVTSGTLETLEISGLTVPSPRGGIDVDRQIITALTTAAADASQLVVGDPGIGKTVALHHLVRHHLTRATPVLFVSVGDVAASSRGDLRTEFGLERDLLEVLAHWAPGVPKLFVVDGLDAARTESQATLWRAVIELVNQLPDWRIVVSIRTWDVQHSQRLPAVFPAPTIDISLLDDAELNQVGARWPELNDLVQLAPPELTLLLRNAFNLRLAAELLSTGTPLAELHDIRNQIQLLDHYWRHRVAHGAAGLARTQILDRFCVHAVEHRTMVVPTTVLLSRDTAAGVHLEALLSRAVLSDATAVPSTPAVGAVRIAHHILFDYAVATTVFASTSDVLSQRLHDDPDLVLFARPSIAMHFERLWNSDVDVFWITALRLVKDPAIPRIAATAAVEIAARRAASTEDVKQLVDAAMEAHGTAQARRLLHYLAVAVDIRLGADAAAPLAVWADVAVQLSNDVSSTELPLRILVSTLVRRHRDRLGLDELAKCGIAARQHLAYMWSQLPSPVTRLAIDMVVATATTAPDATESLLRQALEPDYLSMYGPNDLHALTEGVVTLAPVLPAFVEDLYVAVMLHEEPSTEPTDMIGSAVLPLRSNRRQDVEHAQWNLVEHYPALLDADLERALSAAARIVRSTYNDGEGIEATVGERTFRIVADQSRRWDSSGYRRGNEITDLLHKLEEHFTEASDAAAERAIQHLTSFSVPTAVWRHVLAAAKRNGRLAAELLPLDHLVSGFTLPDLVDPLADLVAAIFPARPEDERRRIEDLVMSMAPEGESDDPGWYIADYRYRQLLHALDRTAVTRIEIIAAQDASTPTPTDGILPGNWLEDGTDRHRPDLTTEADRSAWTAMEELRVFTGNHLNEAPDDDAVAASTAVAERLLPMLADEHLTAAVRAASDDVLARAAEIWTRRGRDVGDDTLSLAHTILLRYHDAARPTDYGDNQSKLTTIPQGPRTDAARGLVQLARFADYCDDDVLKALRALCTDEVPWIRCSVVRGLPGLRGTNAEAMWELLFDRADAEPHQDVLAAVAHGVFGLRVDLDEAVVLLDRAAQRALPTEASASAAEAVTEVAGWLWVWTGHQRTSDILERLTDLDTYGSGGLTSMLHSLRKSGAFTSDDDEIRARTHGLCSRLVGLGTNWIDELDLSNLSDEEMVKVRAAAELLHGVANQIYFASSAHSRSDADGPLPVADIRLADEFGDLVVRLGTLPAAPVTHRLIEFITHVLDARPAWTLYAMKEVVTGGGRQGGYPSDSLAMKSAVTIITRLLADHRGVLQDPACATALREVLDVFVEAGWPEAHGLVFRLENIFR